MPSYEYRCSSCSALTDVVFPVSEQRPTISCGQCGAVARRIISRPSVHLSKASKLDRLDPKYDRMVDKAMADTKQADPDRILKKLKPFPKDG